METPNLFDIATSELSQDAFITWLIQWADFKFSRIDENLHACGVNFAQSLVSCTSDYKVETVKAGRQWENIDIWAEINDEYFLVIEDKKGTQEHSDQLRRYAEIAQKEYQNKKKIVLVYFKMEEQGDYSDIEGAGYSLFSREKMLSLLEQHQVLIEGNRKNNIISDYYYYLKRIDEDINSFKVKPIEAWRDEWYPWKGFFASIQKKIDGSWGYVNNRSGGFWGFWWHDIEGNDCSQYLQLEKNKLCFKIWVADPLRRKEFRTLWHSQIVEIANDYGLKAIKPYRFGSGECMTVAVSEEDYMKTTETGLIDMGKTIEFLKTAEKVIDAIKDGLQEKSL